MLDGDKHRPGLLVAEVGTLVFDMADVPDDGDRLVLGQHFVDVHLLVVHHRFGAVFANVLQGLFQLAHQASMASSSGSWRSISRV